MDNDIEISIFCRLCLAKEEVTRPIFEGKGNSGQTYHKIFTCLPVTLSYNDSLPKSICTNCLQKLDTLYDLWNMSVNSERQLLRWLTQSKANKAGNKNPKTVCLKPEVVHVFEDPQAIVNMIAEREENDDLSSEENGFNYAGPSYANDSSSTSSESTTGNQRKRFRKHKRPNKSMTNRDVACKPKPIRIIKNRSGKIVCSQQKLMAYNIFAKYINMNNSKSKSIQLTAKDVGISESTIWGIVKEMQETGTFTSPPKKRNRSTLFDKLSLEQRKTFCLIIEQQKNSSLEDILLVIQENGTLPRMSKTTLHQLKRKFEFK